MEQAAGGSASGRASWKIWLTGGLLVLGWVALLGLLFALWPVRVSDLPETAQTHCEAVALGSAGASASPAPIAAPSKAPDVAVEVPTDSARRIAAVTAGELADPWSQCGTLLAWTFPLPFEVRLLVIVAIAAALGSFVHVATSFATFIGDGKFDASWLWWYVLRAPIGVALALVVYFAIRGGLLTASALSTSDINPFGIAALSGLVGLFSKQATDKLEETFKALFSTGPETGDPTRGDKPDVPAPAISAVDPPAPDPGRD